MPGTDAYPDGYAMLREQLATRFWAKVQRGEPDACWPWIASRSPTGYGRFGVPRWYDSLRDTRKSWRIAYAHRVAWRISHNEHKPIPRNWAVLHTCDEPSCCNPAHLRLGTQAENMADKRRKGRGRGPQIPKKLTAEQVLQIRRRVAAGEPQRAVAREYGVSQAMVNAIVHRRAWNHI